MAERDEDGFLDDVDALEAALAVPPKQRVAKLFEHVVIVRDKAA